MRPNPQEPADLVTFTEEILNGKLQFFVQCNPAIGTFLYRFDKNHLYVTASLFSNSAVFSLCRFACPGLQVLSIFSLFFTQVESVFFWNTVHFGMPSSNHLGHQPFLLQILLCTVTSNDSSLSRAGCIKTASMFVKVHFLLILHSVHPPSPLYAGGGG